LESWKCSCGIRCADHMSTQYRLVQSAKDCQRRLLSRPRFVRACSATDLFYLLLLLFSVTRLYSIDHTVTSEWWWIDKDIKAVSEIRSNSLSIQAISTADKCVALLLRIREVLSSYLSPETGYPDWGFSWFFSPSRQILGLYLKLCHNHFLPDVFQKIIHKPVSQMNTTGCRPDFSSMVNGSEEF
jgi:hypothetical protein